MNAVADALPEAPDIDMPATPDRVWRAIWYLCSLRGAQRRSDLDGSLG